MRAVDFFAFKALVPLPRVLELIGWKAVASLEGQHRGPCPVHRSSSATSRAFATSGDGWYCHSCKRGGDQVRLWAELHGMNALEAVYDLCSRFGVDPPRLPRKPRKPRVRGNGEEER